TGAFTSHLVVGFRLGDDRGRGRALWRGARQKGHQHVFEAVGQDPAIEVGDNVALAVQTELSAERGVAREFEHSGTKAGGALRLDDEPGLALLHDLARLAIDTENDRTAHRHALE